MAKLKWDQPGEHYYENGVDHVVLFVATEDGEFYTQQSGGTKIGVPGIPWNGVTNVTLSPEGGEPNDIYADNIKYLSLMSAETLGASIEAYSSPKEFDACDGEAELSSTVVGVTVGQQERRKFALAFRTKKGSDAGPNGGYKIHIIYNCLASPSERGYETINDSPDATLLSWDINTTPVAFGSDGKVTALVTIDSSCTKYAAIEAALIGSDGTSGGDSTYQSPDDILAILNAQ